MNFKSLVIMPLHADIPINQQLRVNDSSSAGQRKVSLK